MMMMMMNSRHHALFWLLTALPLTRQVVTASLPKWRGLMDYEWALDLEADYPQIDFDSESGHDLEFKYNYTGALGPERSYVKYLSFALLEYSCDPDKVVSSDVMSLTEGSNQDLARILFATAAEEDPNVVDLFLTIDRSTITGSPFYRDGPDGLSANIKFCLRGDYLFDADADGNTEDESIDFHEVQVIINVDLKAGFELTALQISRNGADEASADLVCEVRAFFCNDDRQEIPAPMFKQGDVMTFCVDIAEQSRNSLFVRDIMETDLDQSNSVEVYRDGDDTFDDLIENFEADPFTVKTCSAGICQISTQLKSKYFRDRVPNPLVIFGTAICGLGSAPPGGTGIDIPIISTNNAVGGAGGGGDEPTTPTVATTSAATTGAATTEATSAAVTTEATTVAATTEENVVATVAGTTTTVAGTTTDPDSPIYGCDSCASVEYFYFKYNTAEDGGVHASGMEYAATSIDSAACGGTDPIVEWLASKGLTTADINDSNPSLIQSVSIEAYSADKPNGYITVDLAAGYWVIEEGLLHKGGPDCFEGTTHEKCSNHALFDITKDTIHKPSDISHVAFLFARCTSTIATVPTDGANPTIASSTEAAAGETVVTTVAGGATTDPDGPISGCDTCNTIEYHYFQYNTAEDGSVNTGGYVYGASSIDSAACGGTDPIVDWLASQGLTTADVNDSNPNLIQSVTVTPYSKSKPNGYIDVDLAPGYWVIEEGLLHKGGNDCFEGIIADTCGNQAHFDITQDTVANLSDISHVAFIFARCLDA